MVGEDDPLGLPPSIHTILHEGTADTADAWILDALAQWPALVDAEWYLLPHPDPAVVLARWWDEDGNKHEVVPRSFKVFEATHGLQGTMTLMPDGTYGTLYNEHFDAVFDITDTADGARVVLSWVDEADHEDEAGGLGVPHPENEDVESGTEAPSIYATLWSTCELLNSNINAAVAAICATVADLLDGSVDTYYEVNMPVGSGTEVRHAVFHEEIDSYATNGCNNAKDRIFDTETNLDYECTVTSVPPSRHGDGLSNGWGDWQDFLDDYFANRHSYKTDTETYNGGRLIHYMVDDSYVQKADGTRVYGTSSRTGCGGGAVWDGAANTRDLHCGHTMQRSYTADFMVSHSNHYRTGQTFTHELGHILGSDHDDTSSASKNYNGNEDCWGWGNDFTSWNLMRSGGNDKKCSHRHYWLGTTVRAVFTTGAEEHATYYP